MGGSREGQSASGHKVLSARQSHPSPAPMYAASHPLKKLQGVSIMVSVAVTHTPVLSFRHSYVSAFRTSATYSPMGREICSVTSATGSVAGKKVQIGSTVS